MRVIRSLPGTAYIKAFLALGIGFLCLGLIVGLQMQRQNAQELGLGKALVSLDHFVASETALRQNVAAARVGIVQDYDETVQLTNQTAGTLSQLQTDFRLLPDQAERVSRVADQVNRQLSLIEEFKSRNAILRNAMAAFSLMSDQLDPASMSPDQKLAATQLGMAILDLTLNTTPSVVRHVDQQIQVMSQIADADRRDLRSLIRQAAKIRTGLPAMDGALRVLSSTPAEADMRELRQAVLARQAAAQAIARRYRYVLSGISGILLLLLIRLGYMVRARARALGRRTRFERFLAEISARLSEPIGIDDERQISHALAMLAETAEADCACAALGPDLSARYAWSRQDQVNRFGWIREVEAIMRRNAGSAASYLHLQEAGRAQSAAENALLKTASLQGLVAARRAGVGLLVVGWSDRPPRLASTETSVLSVSLELLIQAHAQFSLAKEYKRLEVSLRQARRMETLGAFASGIAHNFNNILAAMLGHAEVEEFNRQEVGELSPNLGALRAAGQRGQDLVASILAFGRRDLSGPKRLDGQAILNETLTLLKAGWPAEVQLHVNKCADPVPLAGNATQLQQVLMNVCRNAAQAVIGDGEVFVGLDVIDIAEPMNLSHGVLQSGRFARFRVRDTGRGMDRETLEMIFEPFFTARVGGNGLGLATAWEIVRDHHGFWHVSSSPGMGSTFEVFLPLDQVIPANEPPPAASPVSGQGEAVLLFNPEQLALLRDEEVIAAFGFEPTGFHDPAAAVAACRSSPDRFSAVVIAGTRQVPDLAQFVGKLHACAPAVPILLAASVSAELDLEALSKAGLSDIVAYGASAGNLCRSLVKWVGRQHAARLSSAA